MRITAVRGEKNLDQIVAKVYGDVSPAKATLAKETLLRANPQLAARGGVREGMVVVIPPTAGLEPRKHRGIDEPAAEAVESVSAALTAYRERLAATADGAAGEAAETLNTLKSKDLKQVVRSFAELKDHLSRVEKAAKEQQKLAADVRGFAGKDLKTLEKDLAALASKLR